MKKILIIILSAAVGAIFINYLLIALGFNFKGGVVGGIAGVFFGNLANSFLSKNNITLLYPRLIISYSN